MEILIAVPQKVDIKTLRVKAGARYWVDSEVDGVEDEDGMLMPCIDGEYWCPEIDIETGVITNWTKGVTADIHYKVCDDGIYKLLDADGKVWIDYDGYVPNCLSPGGEGYGDYIIMKVDAEGKIASWKFDHTDFIVEP